MSCGATVGRHFGPVALMRSQIDFGNTVYGSAAKSALTASDKHLDCVQAKSSPSIMLEAGETCLCLRRKRLTANDTAMVILRRGGEEENIVMDR